MTMNWTILFVTLALLFCVANSAQCLNEFNNAASFAFPPNNVDTCSFGVGDDLLNGVTGVAVYESSLLFVSDYNNNRVVSVEIGANAITAAFGQPDFETGLASTTQNGLNHPRGIYVESSGRLWVADYGNNRIAWFDNAAAATGANQVITGVIGQTSFTDGAAGTSRTQLNRPASVFVDEVNNFLWVADTLNERALWFHNYTTRSLGKQARGVIGTSSIYDYNTVGTFFNSPYDAIVDPNQRLYVADHFNNRVVVYRSARNNVPTLYIGQSNGRSTANASTATGLHAPIGLAYDAANNLLFVADYDNNRVVGYQNINTVSANGPAATIFIGQDTTTGNAAGCSASNLRLPWALTFDNAAGQLYVGDYSNSIVLGYCSGISNTPAPTNSASASLAASTSPASRTTGSRSTGSSSTGSQSTGSRSTTGSRRFVA